MRYRKLRITWTLFCGIACVLLVVLWVRSYTAVDGGTLNVSSTWGGAAMSDSGDVTISVVHMTGGDEPDSWLIALPYWLLVMLFACAAALSWIRRFTTRTLLIATTLVAVVLGVIVTVLRWPTG